MWWPDYVPYAPVRTVERRHRHGDLSRRPPVRAAVLETVGAPVVIRDLELLEPRAVARAAPGRRTTIGSPTARGPRHGPWCTASHLAPAAALAGAAGRYGT